MLSAKQKPSNQDTNQVVPRSLATTGLLSSSELSLDRAPRLHTLFEEVCTIALDRLSNLSTAEIELSLERVWAGTESELNLANDETIIVQFALESLSSYVCFAIDKVALHLLIEALLGAISSPRPYAEERDFTMLEFVFAKAIAAHFSSAFSQAFSVVADISLELMQATTGSESEIFVDSKVVFLTSNITLDIFGKTGQLHLFLPQDVLAPLKASFAAEDFGGEKTSDTAWVEHIRTQFQQTEIECRAILDGGDLSLAQVAQMRIGQILELDISPGMPVRLNSEGKDLFLTELGQSNGVFTVKIIQPTHGEESLIDTVLNNHNK